jgi:hypothetical protein
MARMLLLHVSDDADAAALLDKPPQGAVVIGHYFAPTQFCECDDLATKDGYVVLSQFPRGKKYGLYIHNKCLKPRRTHMQHPQNLLVEHRKDAQLNLSIGIRYPYDPEVTHTPFGHPDPKHSSNQPKRRR